MKVSLADRLGNVKKVRVGFSLGHLIFGPLYSLFHLKIFLAIFECLYLFYLFPVPGMSIVTNFILSLSFIPENIRKVICDILMIFKTGMGNYYFIFGVIIGLFIHFSISARIRSSIVKKSMKIKQLLPLNEIDARQLIKFHVCKVNVLLADSFDIRQSNSYKSAEENWYENNQLRLKKSPSFNNRSTLSLTPEDRFKTRLEQIKNSYKLGLISKEEYERKLKLIKGSK